MVNPADPKHYSLIAATLRRDAPSRQMRLGVTTETLLLRLFVALSLMISLAAILWLAAEWEPRILPIRVITVDGEMRSLSRQALQERVASHLTGGILSQDLGALRERVEALPWVKGASLRRVWPDRLILEVSEHEAVARWGEDGLVTREGVIFHPQDRRVPAGLPRLSGADERAVEVVDRLLLWQPRLADLGLLIDALECDRRGDWTLELLGGPVLHFGTEQLERRLTRLLATFPRIEAVAVPERIDLRYSNGLAVLWQRGSGHSDREPTDRESDFHARGKRMAALNEQR
ncbi:Cell division protein FtsQ [Thiorhodovibrio winogradskyi]|uniref:Cell division protein FtsQ n=1 Tax=Thiorhodovibrio winogradskyi TaxID=77007 RepID=A0ABZ0S4V4_9GAMM|nr:cell division protein FtsQ/DivIB [Thiorhodovibrio winogradskyi]